MNRGGGSGAGGARVIPSSGFPSAFEAHRIRAASPLMLIFKALPACKDGGSNLKHVP